MTIFDASGHLTPEARALDERLLRDSDDQPPWGTDRYQYQESGGEPLFQALETPVPDGTHRMTMLGQTALNQSH